jgi:hypothetical protein
VKASNLARIMGTSTRLEKVLENMRASAARSLCYYEFTYLLQGAGYYLKS